MIYDSNPDCEEDKQNQYLITDPRLSFTPTTRDHEIWCSVQGCDCSRHLATFFDEQAAVPTFNKRCCSTIQEVTEPTATFSQAQLSNKFSSFSPQNNKGRNYLNFMSKPADCVAFHTRGKSKLA